MDTALEVVDLHKGFREGARRRDVLCGVDLRIGRGELVALRGRSGSGKSTLLNLCSGIDVPDRGSVRVLGDDITALDERARTVLRRERIGLVFQAFHLLPTLTVAENVMLPLDLAGRPPREARARAIAWLGKVGLDDRGESYPDVLSGGEQQRVCLARALVHEPVLVLADEPTGNLDEDSARIVLDLLATLCRSGGHAVLLATHSATAAARADRALRVEHGRVAPVASEVR